MSMQDKSMWDSVNGMSDQQTDADPDNAPTDALFWSDVDMQELYMRKIPLHIRVAHDVLEYFRKDGPGYETPHKPRFGAICELSSASATLRKYRC